MGIQFNGKVTINGNVEMYDNGSMKIIGNQVNIDVKELPGFIEDNFKYSSDKSDYVQAAEVIQSSEDPKKIKVALEKLGDMAKELGKNIFFSGLSQVIIDIIKNNL